MLRHDVTVIVGAGGMGEAIARRGGAGRRILLADLDRAHAAAVAERLEGDGFGAVAEAVDVCEAPSIDALAARAQELGPVRSVVVTSGVSPSGSDARVILATNLIGVGRVIETFGDVIAPGGAGVVICSMAADFAPPIDEEVGRALALAPVDELPRVIERAGLHELTPGDAYRVSKRGIRARTAAASLAWARRGARLNSLSPGHTITRMGRHEESGAQGERIRALLDLSAAGRAGTATEIADAAAFLLSEQASYVTGTDLLVDGGAVAAQRWATR
ncbi:SDR family oxidoreductase [Microbacterium sp. No. 7]|uniref:SDR family oxidoreductase n=1 Tax=Microbacterium sp. No. 7 TaxID=1714373 RepID=UPI0006D175A4|nr:SDR family oxidoreductase [Microbacterium sp. No. 7]ALJ18819.1 hypothetical protein AOA12_02375 [Microbacterium sp. No. 7]